MFHISQDSLIGKGSKVWTVFQIFEEFHAKAALKIQPRIKPLLKSIDCYNTILFRHSAQTQQCQQKV
jgi:hypothetical protein